MSDHAVDRSDTRPSEVPIEMSTSGPLSSRQRAAVESMVDRVIRTIEERVVHARVRAELHPERTTEPQVMVRVVLDIRGGPVRARVQASTVHEAIDAVEHRLRDQLRNRAERRHVSKHRPAEDGWRHGDRGSERPPYFPRPVDERRIVRHKSFAPGASSVEEALFDLESMSYDFFLFVESTTASDALVAKTDDGGYSVHYLAGTNGPVPPAPPAPAGVAVDDHPAPEIDLATAQERLDVGHEPLVFFRDAVTGRGHVLYRRYDGHYGLIVPLDEPD